MGTYLVQEISVMRYNDNRVLKVDEEFLKPCDGIHIKVVCRLIQKKYIRIAKKGLGKKHLDLESTIQILHQAVVILCAYSKSVQECGSI